MSQMNPLLNQTVQNSQLNGIQTNNTPQYSAPKVDLTQKPDSFESSTAEENAQKPKKGKGLKTAAILLGVAAAAAGIIYAIKKGKTKTLADVDFNKGVASLKGTDEKFTGVIKDTLKNGDKIKIKYEDGIRQSSVRKGPKGIIKKIFKTAENGDNIVETIKNGEKTIANTTKKSKEGAAKAIQRASAPASKPAPNPIQTIQQIADKTENLSGNLKDRLSKIEQACKNSGRRYSPREENIAALSKCSEETISLLPDGVLRNFSANKGVTANIGKLESDFTPQGLKKLMETGEGKIELLNYLNMSEPDEIQCASEAFKKLLGADFIGKI